MIVRLYEQIKINVIDHPFPQGELLEPSCRRSLPLALRGRGPQREDGGRVDAAALRRQVERLRVRRDPASSGTIGLSTSSASRYLFPHHLISWK